MQKLPIGIQDFENLRNDAYVYVDKTNHVYQLITGGKNYFLSRPRRFGKSLFINTLKNLFLGNKHLFSGLYIEDKIEWKTSPIIHLDFSAIDCEVDFRKGIEKALLKNAKQNNIQIEESKSIRDQFEELILELSKIEKVVILIDEYDKPILHFIDRNNDESQAKAHQNREIMREFYSVLKSLDGAIRFLFITGITRFSKTSLFSDMNHLQDISMMKKYSDICGYTQIELEYYFKEEIETYSQQQNLSSEDFKLKIKTWYNGYRWDVKSESVYNPFSIINFLANNGKFENFWFSSGMPTFLLKTIDNNEDYDFNEIEADELMLNNFNIDNLQSVTLLFQAGYLTIKSVQEELYTLVYPNFEVKSSLLRSILNDKMKQGTALPQILHLRSYFETKDYEKIEDTLNALFAKIPYQIFLSKSEAYYHSILVVAFQLLGCYTNAEVSVAKGRIDAVVKTKDLIYVIEFKVKTGSAVAMQQIEDRAYLKGYQNEGKALIALGVVFENKEVKEFVVKEY